ncbi:MAG: hypothetical protein ACRDNL_12200 [Spirillospora sp.]
MNASAQVRTLTPYLCVDGGRRVTGDGRRALRWYADAFGAEGGGPFTGLNGRVAG